MTKKKKREKRASATELWARSLDQIAWMNRRYEALFEFANDPNALTMENMTQDVIPVTLERDMKAGETLMVSARRASFS